MAKQFFTEGTGNQQVLHTAQDDKIPVYENKDAVEADFANLAENQIVATKDMGVDPSVVPVGFIVPQYKKVARKGWLYLDGSEFDENEYPALYLYLGTNVLPDYREFGLVGAEENTTSANITTHDVYTQGQEKDDQLQNFKVGIANEGGNANCFAYGSNVSFGFTDLNTVTDGVTRSGGVTRGKRKAVYYYIKAVDGEQIANESQFLTTVKNYLKTAESYSTEETLTGGTWIDGKPIYRKVIYFGALPNADQKLVNHNIANLGVVIKQYGYTVNGTSFYPIPRVTTPRVANYCIALDVNSTSIIIETYTNLSLLTETYIILEYTKTTD